MSDKGVALVTGAAGAMGSACVRRLNRDGFTVALMDIDEARLEQSLAAAGTGARSWCVDQTDEGAVRAAVAEIEEGMGPIEALANTVGWTAGTRFDEEDSAYWHKVVAINYMAALYVTHPVLNAMIGRKRGKIVFITSDAAKIGTGGEAVYAGAKAAECAFAKSIARECAATTSTSTAPLPVRPILR